MLSPPLWIPDSQDILPGDSKVVINYSIVLVNEIGIDRKEKRKEKKRGKRPRTLRGDRGQSPVVLPSQSV